MDIKKAAVIGTGLMGTQIAMQIAIHGYQVVCYDINKEMVAKAADFSEGWFEKRVTKQKMTVEETKEIKKRLKFSSDLQETGEHTDIVIEAVSDIVDIKKSALSSIDKFTPDHTIYASNSSYIVSSRFADAVKDPSKVLNVHF